MATGLLSDIRVVDLASGLAEATGRCLADLGAEVIKVEPPGGCEARHRGPYDNKTGESLHWRAWGLGKHSVVLDIEDPADRGRLADLIDTADVLVESFGPVEIERYGLEADAIARRNPSLVHVSITPFGRTGPRAGAPASDITLAAAGGLLNHQGDKDRPPIPIGFPEAANHGAVSAAADAIAALHERDRSGLGQHLDSSMQAAVVGTLLWTSSYATIDRNPGFTGDDRASAPTERGRDIAPGIRNPVVEPCADGHVVMIFGLGLQGNAAFAATVRWVEEEGALDSDLCGRQWESWIDDMKSGELAVQDGARAMNGILDFIKTKTKAEIHARSVSDKLLIAPCNNAADLLSDPQLVAREFWVDVDGVSHPGPFAILEHTPISYDRPAPRLGADQALLDHLPPRQYPPVTAAPRGPIFEGLKVADLTWMAAGPLITRELANHGATVVHAESAARLDTMRRLPPFHGGGFGADAGLPAANANQSKLGLACNFSVPESKQVIERLIEWADVVVENFRPGMAQRNGFGWQQVKRLNPRAVMVSTSMRGQTGPEATLTGFGLQGAALAGFVDITGWPDRAPIAPWGAYTDFVSPRYALCALIASLRHQARTGQGQYIDLSQNETGVHYLAPMVLDHGVNGHLLVRPGDRAELGSPSGVFRGEGSERFLVVSAQTDHHWAGVRSVVPELASSEYDQLDADARLLRRDEIEARFTQWAAGVDVFEAADILLASGVPAYPSLRAKDLIRDSQLVERCFFTSLSHSVIKGGQYDGPVTLFSGTPWRAHSAGPTIGEHNERVLSGLLGFTDDEITLLAEADVLI